MLKILKRLDLKILAIGMVVFHTLDYGFDYVLYPLVIYKYGLYLGYVIMTSLSASACLLLSHIYDSTRRDWLGIEFVKEAEEEIKERLRKKDRSFISWLIQRSNLAKFIFLSIKFDPFITAMYMRRGIRSYNGYSFRDWKIFWASVFASNAWWALFSFGVVSFLKLVYIIIFAV